jgi:alpha-1,6-mannosyltransferase
VVALVRRFAPDVIEVGDPYCMAWFGWWMARRLGIPVVAFYHSDYPRASARTVEKYLGAACGRIWLKLITAYLRALYTRMDAVVVATRRFESILAQSGIGNLVHIPLGTDPTVFHPRPSGEAVRADLGLAAGQKFLLYVGRLAREKNIRRLLEILQPICSAEGGPRLVIVGDGELGDWVREQAASNAWLIWRPYCTNSDALAEYYSAADALVHPGMVETFGLSPVEAQSCGTPVVGFAGGGLDEALAPFAMSRLVPGNDAEAFRAAVGECLAETPSMEERMRRHDAVRGQFDATRTAERMLNLYRQLRMETEAAAAPMPPIGASPTGNRLH